MKSNSKSRTVRDTKWTNTQVVWRSLVNVRLVKAAVHKLKQINWLSKDVDPDSVDDATLYQESGRSDKQHQFKNA